MEWRTGTRQPSILLLGATSIVGYSIYQAARGIGLPIRPSCNRYVRHPVCEHWDRINLDDGLYGSNPIHALISSAAPDILIHCGGICDVDVCEAHPEWAYRINVASLRPLLQVLPRSTRLVYCSSDHVFSGDQGPVDERSTPDPLSVCGQTRVAAETQLLNERPDTLIVRYPLPIGRSYDGRRGHLDWLTYRTRRGLPTTVVADEARMAVWAAELAGRVIAMALSPIQGLRHLTGRRLIFRPALAYHLNQQFQLGATIQTETRQARSVPHLGQVELKTQFDDWLGEPLTSVVDGPPKVEPLVIRSGIAYRLNPHLQDLSPT